MDKISIGTFDFEESDIVFVVNAIKSGFISSGPQLDEFEQRCSSIHGKKYGLMVNSGQTALELAIILAQIKLNKTKLFIAVPATTYAATVWAIIQAQCVPVFCDIDKTYNIDYTKIPEEADAVLAVDLCGKTANIPEEVRSKYFIIEDACEAFGNKSCNYGDIVCLSFYVSHIVTTGAGGMICLDDEELYEFAKSYIAHGRTYGGDFTKFTDKWVDRFKFDKIGVSWRGSNFAASLAIPQLNRLEDIISRRRDNAFRLIKLYYASPKLQRNFLFPSMEYWGDSVFQFFPILIRRPEKINREKLLNFLFENKIDSRVLLSLTNQPIFTRVFGDISNYFPISAQCNEMGFLVGCHQNLSREQIDFIISALEEYVCAI